MFREAINKVLCLNNQSLDMVIEGIKEESLDDTELILQLSIIQARSEVLEILTEDLDQYELVDDEPEQITTPPPPDEVTDPAPDFIAKVEIDNPDKEDEDLKKERQEKSRKFYA